MKAPTKYLKTREDAINILLEKPRQSYTSGTFHKLRVEIKKLNAFFNLIKFCSKDFEQKRIFKPFKLIFRQAGKIREIQVEEAMLKKYFVNNLLKNYRSRLRKTRLRERNKFFSLVNETFVGDLKKSYTKIAPFVSKIEQKRANNYTKEQKNRIKKLLANGNLKTAKIHELRKQLKNYYYNQKSLHLQKQKNISTKNDILSQLLGKWHDRQVIIKHLKNAINSEEISPEEMRQLKEIKVKISSDAESLLAKIKTAIPASGFLGKQTQN